MAWEDESPDNLYYLDTRTGAVKLVHQHLIDLHDLTDEIEKNRERFLYVPKPKRNQTRADLHAFLSQVETSRLLPILKVAFESPHFFMAFRKILASEPAELEKFQKERARVIQERIDEWLMANNYAHDPDFVNQADEIDEPGDERDDYLHDDFDDLTQREESSL